jgi:hypothetical protein
MATTVRWLSGITMVLVSIQAVLIGQGLFLGDSSRTTLHGWIGNATVVGAIVLAGLSVFSVRRGELSRPAIVLSVLVALLTVAQIGLGPRSGSATPGVAEVCPPPCTYRTASSLRHCWLRC